MFARLLLLFTVVPFVELMLLLRLSDWMGWESTLGLVLLTGVIGAALARREGFRTLSRIQTELSNGAAPAGELVDAAMIFVAGALLVTPGILTDAVGFALLIRPCRRALRAYLARRFSERIKIFHQTDRGYVVHEASAAPTDRGPARHVEVIDVQATSAESEPRP